MMDPRVPDEVGVQKVPQVVAARGVRVPAFHTKAVDFLEPGILIAI
jgi:hypothetical protein